MFSTYFFDSIDSLCKRFDRLTQGNSKFFSNVLDFKNTNSPSYQSRTRFDTDRGTRKKRVKKSLRNKHNGHFSLVLNAWRSSQQGSGPKPIHSIVTKYTRVIPKWYREVTTAVVRCSFVASVAGRRYPKGRHHELTPNMATATTHAGTESLGRPCK